MTDTPSNKPKQFKTRSKHNKEIHISDPKIDKLSVITYSTPEDARGFRALLAGCSLEGIVLTLIERSRTTTEFHLYKAPKSMGESFMNIQISPQESRMRFEFNPSRFDDELWKVMDDLAQSVFGVEAFANILAATKITSLDVCRDAHGMHVEDFFFKAKGMRARDNFKKDHTGTYETINFGVSSGNSFCVYNKAAEQGWNPLATQPWTRIEYTLKPSSALYMADLLEVRNPFLRLEIHDLDLELADLIPENTKIWFMDSCRFRGVMNALKAGGLDRKAQEKIKLHLGKRVFPLWRLVQEGWRNKWIKAVKEVGLYDVVMAAQDMAEHPSYNPVDGVINPFSPFPPR